MPRNVETFLMGKGFTREELDRIKAAGPDAIDYSELSYAAILTAARKLVN